MSGECDKCGHHALECTCPTILNREDIDKFVEKLMTSEIKEKKCFTCEEGFYFENYGHSFGECDQCYFDRWPKEEREDFLGVCF